MKASKRIFGNVCIMRLMVAMVCVMSFIVARAQQSVQNVNPDYTQGTPDLNKQVMRESIISDKPAPTDEKVYVVTMVEMKPEFPGGESEMYNWLAEHMVYPAQAVEDGAQGRVVVTFIISKEGNIEDAKVVRSRHPALDAEALRLVKAMPRWTPGKMNGVPVRVSYTLPITFKLN